MMPLGRVGESEEIAGPLVFLVSDLASFMSGQTRCRDYDTVRLPSIPSWKCALPVSLPPWGRKHA